MKTKGPQSDLNKQEGSGKSATLEIGLGPDRSLLVVLKGNWLMRSHLPGWGPVQVQLLQGVHKLEFDTTGLELWDSGLVNFVLNCYQTCQRAKVELTQTALPMGVQKLLRLAITVRQATEARTESGASSWLECLGTAAKNQWSGFVEIVSFLGDNVVAMLKLLRGKAQFRWSDAALVMQQCGPQALGVVALINFLVGVILAFVGAVQLKMFGASIYVADLVAIGTVREMGCIMTGVILCGRTGAAFAAQLGAMRVNEEIDAFKTLGISPIEFLVLPRLIALLLMMPLLCVFADAIAIFGGFVVSISMLDVTAVEYLRRTVEAITLKSFLLGVFKGGFFGILVAVFGCLRGMQCGTNAAAVGQATTSAVVTGITSIVAADGIFAVLCNALKI